MESLFGFTGKDLRDTYPEISECEEFKKLTKQELVFVWYYANKTSPYYLIGSQHAKVLKCLPILKDTLSDEDFNRYVDLRFPPHLSNAINRMEEFDPELRSIAKTVTGQILDNIRKAVSEDVDNYTEAGDKKSYIDMCINIGKNLPDLVKSLERGYGINKVDVKEVKELPWEQI